MSDDSDYGTRTKRKRSVRYLSTSPSTASTSSGSSIVGRHRQRRRFIEDDSDSDSGSSIEVRPKRKATLRVDSDADSDSSGSVIVPRSKRPARVVSDSDSDSDHGFEGSSSSWETDTSDMEIKNTAKKQDTGVESDTSDGTSEKCPICLISFTNQEIGSPELCDHMFCIDCIQEWSKNMNTCPVDRREYNVILVRKGINGKVYKRLEVQPPNPQNEVNIVEDPTFCEVCGLSDGEDRMLLCDGCDLGFHLECLEPPLTEVPIGAWFCHDCTPEDVVDPEIELYELQLLLDDANDLGRPRNARRTTASRLIPRTRQSERVRRRVVTNRSNQLDSPQPVTSSTSTQRPKKKKKRKKARKPRYRIVYQVDEATGETIQVKKRVKKRKMKKRRRRAPPTAKTARERLAAQLGICAPSTVPQSLPSVRVHQTTNLQSQRYSSGIPTLRLFGDHNALDMLVSEDEGDGSGVISRRSVSFRRNFVKSVIDPVSSSTDVLGSILEVQSAFHSKSSTFSIGQNGTLRIESKKGRMLKELNNYSSLVRRVPTSSNDTRNDVPTSSENTSSPERNNTAPTSTVENSTVAVANSSASGPSEDNPESYNENFYSTHEGSDEKRKEKKKETSETNTPRSGTPASESEIDIYSDIETVTTSKQDEPEFKQPSPRPVTPSAATDDDNNDNDSDTDMVIDTENPSQEVDETKEPEEAVTSTVETVDPNVEAASVVQTVTSTSEIQSQAVESSDKTVEKSRDEDEDSEDGCPNFSIYSRESITLAKNTDISLPSSDNQENNQVSEISSSPAEKPQESKPKETEGKKKTGSGLYSDSEDENVVKKGLQNSFGIPDLQTMTEDISEEERSYTPCLDERPQRLFEGLDTELISDEDRNDFDESHELKTASDGDALEINAKESELDFTRPEDYEEGEIVDKSKKKAEEKEKEEETKKEEDTGNKENENQNTKESSFKKLSKNNKERNYRDKDKERERSRSRDNKRENKRDKKKEKRKEIERYDVRALIADKPRRDKFGRDINRSLSRSSFRTPSPRRSFSRGRRSPSIGVRRSRSVSRKRSLSRGRKKRRRSKTRLSRSRSRSRSPERRRSRSKQKKRRRSPSREKRRKSRDRSKLKTKKRKSRSRQRSISPSPKRAKDWRRNSREWTPSLSPSRSPELRHLSPSWTPPRMMDNSVKPHNLTVILTNDGNKKKKDKRKKGEKRTKENDKQKKKKRNEKTPQPSKEVFASGDNILVSVSFNKDNETRDVSTKKKRDAEELKKTKKEKTKKKKKTRDLSGVKPVAIIDLEKSPFKELTPSPKDVIVLSDSDTEENRNMQKAICDSSQQVASPERLNSYTTGPKTPPEPQVKFTLAKQTTLRAITNPLHDPDDVETEGDTQEDVEHKGPNTPPEPPNSPPSSPDAYDPFEPTKSRSPTPEAIQTTQSNSTLNLDDNRENSIIEARTETEKSTTVQQPDLLKSLTPPLADVQPADSQSSMQITPESSLSKSPERSTSAPLTTPALTVSKPIAQTIPFSSSVATSMMTSTPVSTSLAPPRINILNSTIITPSASTIPQRIVLPNVVKSSPVKISPTKPPIKSTPIKPMLSKTPRKTGNRNQNGSDSAEINLGLDSPYSPGSSDYEDLFEPPVESATKPAPKTTTTANKTKSPAKVQNAFDALFGTSPFNKVKTKSDKPAQSKFNKKPNPASGKGTKQVGVKLDEDNLKILDDLPNSAVEMQVKDKFLKKLNRQERVVEEVKLVLKPHYNKKHINKDEYKDILRRAVPKICHNKSGEINPTKIKNLIEAYVKKVRHSKKVTSSSSVNTQKA